MDLAARQRALHGLIGLVLSAASGCAAQAPSPAAPARSFDGEKASIARRLDDFHSAAARADEQAYFAAFSDSAVFLGTDATERWDVPAFRAYATPHFAQGHGWEYRPRARHITLAASGDVAWFDELLEHDKYGELRGTGVLVHERGAWKITQYNLTFTIPNASTKRVIDALKPSADSTPSTP